MKAQTFPFLIGALYVAFTPIISVYFALARIPVPAYLFATLIAISIIAIQIGLHSSIRMPKWGLLSGVYLIYGVLVIASFVLFSNFSAPSEKLINVIYVLIAPIAVIATSIGISKIGHTNQRSQVDDLYYKLFNVSTFLLLLAFLFARQPETDGRYVLPGLDNPIWVARHFGAGLVVYLLHNLLTRGKLTFTQLSTSLLILGFLVLTGSRAPVLAVIVTLILVLSKTRLLSKSKAIILFLTMALLLAGMTVLSDSYLFDTDFYSGYRRLDSLAYVADAPFRIFGHGLSSFGRHYLSEDVDIYPHNLFGELIFEFGIFGLVLSFGFCAIVMRVYASSIAGILTMYYFINAMFSGDVPGNAPLFIAAAIAWHLYRSSNNNKPAFMKG